MPTQITKPIDVIQGFQPVDPNTFPENLMLSGRTEESSKSEFERGVVPYEGYNFLPTSYGYRSYFGTASQLDIDSLSSRVDDIFVIQTTAYTNIAVALCEDGIWTKSAQSAGAWVQEITLDIPAEGVHYNWTKAFIGNRLFCYRANGAAYFVFSPTADSVSPGEIEAGASAGTHPANEFYSVTPNFLNMAGQEGIFKAGSRLGFWDSANSIAWSSLDDYADFKPALLTLAGNSIFAEVAGRIVSVLTLGDGFVIYSTKSITSILRKEGGSFQWDPIVLEKDIGIAFMREACLGESHETQYAYTPKGLMQIKATTSEILVPAVVDFLKESREPIFLKVLENRFLFLELLDSNYVDGLVSLTVETIPSSYSYYPDIGDGEGIIATQLALEEIRRRQYDSLLPEELVAFDSDLENNIGANPPESVRRLEGTEVLPVLFGGDSGKSAIVSKEYFYTLPSVTIQSRNVNEVVPPHLFNNPEDWDVEDAYFSYSDADPDAGDYPYAPLLGPDYTTTSPATFSYIDTSNYSYVIDQQIEEWATSEANALTALATMQSNLLDPVRIGNLNFLQIDRAMVVNNPLTVRDSYIVSNPDLDPIEFIDRDYPFKVPLKQTTAAIIKQDEDSDFPTFIISCANPKALALRSRINITHPFTGGLAPPIAAQHSVVSAEVDIEDENDQHISGRIGGIISGYSYTNELGEAAFIDADLVPLMKATWSALNVEYFQGYAIVYPPATFLLQGGSIGPIYPTITAALVYDLQLSKWGKMKVDYKCLLDWSPINNSSGDIIPYSVFGIKGGVIKADGYIYLFDKYPVDSYIKYGKIGYFRQGFTKVEEVRVHFRNSATGKVRTEASLDGSAVEMGLIKETEFTDVQTIIHYPDTSARWHTISLIGIWDVRYMEVRATKISNR